MCRNIRTLHNFEPPATDDEVHGAALQYVRKISGAARPSQANSEAFDRAVEAVTAATRELPDRLREAVGLLAPSDVFPFAGAASQGLDVDHPLPYHPAGAGRAERHRPTRLGNLGPLTRTHHRIKTHGAWTLRQPFPGIYLWRDPPGMLYLEDHTGTHPVGAPRVHDPDVDLYPADNLIEADFGRQA